MTLASKDILKDKSILCFIICVFCFSILTFFFSIWGSILLLFSLIGGLSFPFLIFSPKQNLPNLLALFISEPSGSVQRELTRSCSICGGEECNRQHQNYVINTSSHAHNDFTVPQSFDDALEELLTLVLDNHVYSWYKEMTLHDQLADEIRYVIRYAASAIGKRLTKVDLTSLILNRLIPAGIPHLDAFLESKHCTRVDSRNETYVIQYLKARGTLHPALESRDDEINYLKAIFSAASPYIIPKKYTESRSGIIFLEELIGKFLILKGLDLLADPDTVNLLFLLLFEPSETPLPTSFKREPQVLLLKNFASVNTHPRNSIHQCNLSSVLKDQTLLYLFHIFLKEECAINILQFCLAVEDFNRHILDPELTREQLEQLHKDALDLYHTYMVSTAYDKLNFQPSIVQEIKEIVHGDVCDIVKLRTTRPLFQAYEYAYNLLEREYMPLFIRSNSYFGNLFGSRHSQISLKNSSRDELDGLSRNPIRVGKDVVKRVGSGLKSIGKQIVMKPSVIIGDECYLSDDPVDEGEDICAYLGADDGSSNVNEPRSTLESLTQAFRDLSAWRLTIPRVESRVDQARKISFVFIVDVTRIDVSGDDPEELHWQVERRYQEFYILESKLTEFHGEFPNLSLPPRRSLFTSKGMDFMQSRKLIFEEFLQGLLQIPCLKGSQLLFLFLKTKDEFTMSYLPEVSLGRLLRDVPRKLIKERGQYLEPFISTFISSTDVPVRNKAAFDLEDMMGDEKREWMNIPEDPCIKGDIFQDNGRSLKLPRLDPFIDEDSSPIKLNGIFEICIFAAVKVFAVSMNFLQWAMCFKAILGNTIDAAISWFLRKKLSQALSPPQLVKLVHLIRDALYFDPPPKCSAKQKMQRVESLRTAVATLLPSWLINLLFKQNSYQQGINILVSFFQHPILNKQLSYVLLDIVLEEVFPELKLEENLQVFPTLTR